MIPTHNYLILTAQGQNRSDTMCELTRSCQQCGCNILQARFNTFGQDIAIVLFLSGNWGAIAKMEATLPALEQRLNLTIQGHRTREPLVASQTMAYTIQITAIDQIGILNGVTDFLLKLGVTVEEITAHTYLAHTGTRMVSLQLKTHVPGKIHLATMREQFMNYCDDHNLDVFLEPVRNIS